MVKIPMPSVGNVTLVISDGTGYMSVEVDRSELVQIGAPTAAMDFLDAELISVERPNARLQQSMEDVAKFREGGDG
jgi:hypothetical protein